MFLSFAINLKLNLFIRDYLRIVKMFSQLKGKKYGKKNSCGKTHY